MSLRTCYADIDTKNGRSMAGAFAAISTVKLPPDLVLLTGGGFQPLWLFKQPLPNTEVNASRVEALGAQIAELTGGDAVANVDRILRLPFTVNYPNQKKRSAGRVACLSGVVLRRVAT